MSDKERILMVIITRIIPGLAYGISKRDEYIESHILSQEKLQKGDLVFATTSFTPNDFLVGFIESLLPDGAVIREIGSTRLCNYCNESFTKINKEKLGYEILEGVQYETYRKVLKAFEKHTAYYTRFKYIEFDGNICFVQARKAFENDILFQISFEFDGKTSIKKIGARLAEAEKGGEDR